MWDEDDLRTSSRSRFRAEVKQTGNPDVSGVEVFSPFSANLVVKAGPGVPIIYASRTVSRRNPYHPRRTTAMNPEMRWWYERGAAAIMPDSAALP